MCQKMFFLSHGLFFQIRKLLSYILGQIINKGYSRKTEKTGKIELIEEGTALYNMQGGLRGDM